MSTRHSDFVPTSVNSRFPEVSTDARYAQQLAVPEDQPLISLTYISSAVRNMTGSDLVELLRVARTNNQRLNVSGMLLYKDGDFMQTLEGPEPAVKSLVDKIVQDGRHRRVIRLLSKTITERAFSHWSMAFHNLDGMRQDDLTAFSPFLNGSLLDDAFRRQPEQCYKLMLSFRANIR